MSLNIQSALNAPFNNKAVIEGTLLEAFPAVWQGVYYFDRIRGRKPREESNIVSNLIQRAHNIAPRDLRHFEDSVAKAVDSGCGRTIPLSNLACYLMTEKDRDSQRLTGFFGKAALSGVGLKWLARIFEEYVARHELYHSVEMLEPGWRPTIIPLRESEKQADAYSLLSMFRLHGEAVHPFVSLLMAAREHQYACNVKDSENSARNYLTQPAIRNVMGYLQENGLAQIQAMDETAVFRTAKRLGTPRLS